MKPLLVLCVSRNRPESVQGYMESFCQTSDGVADVVWGIDNDDPKLIAYEQALVRAKKEHPICGEAIDWRSSPRLGMGGTVNALAMEFADDYQAVGYVCDDFRYRTKGWDTRVNQAFEEWPDRTGVVYCNDLLHGPGLPTEVFLSSNIILAMGFFGLPSLKHLYIDNFHRTLGNGLGRIKYLGDVIIEHMHPNAGKAPWDSGYYEVNSSEMYRKDGDTFKEWEAKDSFNFIEQLKRKLNIA